MVVISFRNSWNLQISNKNAKKAKKTRNLDLETAKLRKKTDKLDEKI